MTWLRKWGAYLWLRYGRGWYSRFRRWLQRKYRNTEMPVVNNLFDVELALREVTWRKDRMAFMPIPMDFLSTPEAAWATKRGDCDDFAVLACKLIEQLGIKGYILTAICKPQNYSHTVCVFEDGGKVKWFDNSALIEHDFPYVEHAHKIYTYYEYLALEVAGESELLCYSAEDADGKIIVVRRV